MGISISHEQEEEFLQKLDPRKLANLTADILFMRNHTAIKIVDGPGDGCRDIHSISQDGEKYLTQCKFHNDIAKSVSSREGGELPLGMIKLGYEKGLFVTNAKISPQTKREFLDNYPGLELDFIDGTEIIKSVFNNLVLRSIWYDGKSIDKISHIITIPMVARNLYNDKHLVLLPESKTEEIDSRKIQLRINDINVEVRLRESVIHSLVFEPYRPPTIKTFREPWSSTLLSIEAVITGIELLADLNSVLQDIGSSLLHYFAKENSPLANHYIALRLGKSTLLPLSGDSIGGHIELPFSPQTFILKNHVVYDEEDIIIPSGNSGWRAPEFFRVLESSWVRWYNCQLDTCLNMTILSPPDGLSTKMIEEQREFISKYWDKSVFSLFEKNGAEELLQQEKLPVPDEILDWYENKLLFAWFHDNLKSMFRPALLERDEGFEVQQLEETYQYEEETVNEEFIKIIEQLGGEVVKPHDAYHMFVLSKGDPLPNKEEILYRPLELQRHFKEIPSPIDPTKRKFEFITCWLLQDDRHEACYIEELLNSSVEAQPMDLICNIRIDNNYLIMETVIKEEIGHVPTDELLSIYEPVLDSFLNKIEEVLQDKNIIRYRCTREYWKTEIGISLPK